MTSRVNSLPPPWPNQALAQAREASQVPAIKSPESSSSEPVDEVAISAAKPPASEGASDSEANAGDGTTENSVAKAVTGSVNVVA